MSKIAHLALNDEGFVFDPSTGDSFMLNPTGLFILKKLRDNVVMSDIIKAVSAEYDIAADEAERDINDFCGQLKSLSVQCAC
ncbi:MAG: HPr-rel-A system PqqD family peptide chaperone [Planctomycetota bacterium]